VTNQVSFMSKAATTFRTVMLFVSGLRGNIIRIMVQVLVTTKKLFLPERLETEGKCDPLIKPILNNGAL